MMRTVGRLVLIGVGIAMIVLGVIALKDDIEIIKSMGGFNQIMSKLFSGDASVKAVFINFLYQCFVILVGASGVLAGVFNRCGFWFTIFSIILLVLIVIRFVNESKSGALKDIKYVLKIVADVGLQIGYVLGFVILKIAKKRE